MLLNLHVKNLALIEQADVEFGPGLNILTGETGAGKSIIIGSVNLALGAKVSKDIIRQGCDYGYVELIFSLDSEEKIEALRCLDIEPDQDGVLIISKKITPQRSISKINDETVTAARLKQVTGLLIDIHGQHEHQSLLYPSRHLEILDEYAKSQTLPLKQKVAVAYQTYTDLTKQLASFQMNQEERVRQADFYRFEIDEIEQAGLKPGEEEQLTGEYRKLSNARKITSNLQLASEAVETEQIARALKAVVEVSDYDPLLKPISDQLFDIEALLSDVKHSLFSYLDDMEFDQEALFQMEQRLDLIHNLQAKYGKTIEEIHQKLEEKRHQLNLLEDFDRLKAETEKQLEQAKAQLSDCCARLSEVRKKAAIQLTRQIKEGLSDLNFLDTVFTMEFETLSDYTPNGLDRGEFLISTNPGEPVKPLASVASGGELSRIMLAIKAVLAVTDDIPTLIFDEIDAGISGRTAQMVSQKLTLISANHQILCITHLPQIAAMAHSHFEIVKEVDKGKTTTRITRLDPQASIGELARLLGGAKITDAVLQNAREMKEMAQKQ